MRPQRRKASGSRNAWRSQPDGSRALAPGRRGSAQHCTATSFDNSPRRQRNRSLLTCALPRTEAQGGKWNCVLRLSRSGSWHGTSQHPATKPWKQALAADGIPATQFGVDDVNGEHERLLELGVHFAQPPTPTGPVTTAVLDDTCGNLLQLVRIFLTGGRRRASALLTQELTLTGTAHPGRGSRPAPTAAASSVVAMCRPLKRLVDPGGAFERPRRVRAGGHTARESVAESKFSDSAVNHLPYAGACYDPGPADVRIASHVFASARAHHQDGGRRPAEY
jgi:hypothetical protein